MKQFLVAAILALLSGQATAGSTRIGAQYGLTQPYTENYNMPSACPGTNYNQVECVQVPGRILGWIGTVTVKKPLIEVLSAITCNGEFIWVGEQFEGTLVLVSPTNLPNELTGP